MLSDFMTELEDKEIPIICVRTAYPIKKPEKKIDSSSNSE